MVEKNDFTVFRKYEGDRKFYDYNFDMIKDELLKAVEGLIVEDKVVDYIVDIEAIVEQIVDELEDANWYLNDVQQDYSSLEEEKKWIRRRSKIFKRKNRRIRRENRRIGVIRLWKIVRNVFI